METYKQTDLESLYTPDEGDRPRTDLLAYAKSLLGDVATAVELGVAGGTHARLIKKKLRPNKLYLIDAWGLDAEYNELTGEDKSLYVGTNLDELKRVRDIFSTDIKKERVFVRRERTQIAHSDYPDGYFDFIYIDGDHRYKACNADIKNWFPKLAKGGVISGHDYIERPLGNGDTYGVIEAVQEFLQQNKEKIQEFVLFGAPPIHKSWLIKTRRA